MNHRKAYTATHYQESQTRSVIPDEHHTTWEESYLELHKGRSWPCDDSREGFTLVL
jgi:hypothetical protein